MRDKSIAKVIDLRITTQEAHVILRALATHGGIEQGTNEDSMPCTWIAERILRIIAPDLGVQPIAAIEANEQRSK